MFGQKKPVTTTTGAPGRPIPNLIIASGEKLPFGTASVDIVTLQNAPIRAATINEIARVIKPIGDIRLLGPYTPEVLAAHREIAKAVGGRVYQVRVGKYVFTNILVSNK
jgi:ubiquinone/menaquinone biosynthesis C-methylase UbiE